MQVLTPCDEILINKRNEVETLLTRRCWDEYLLTGRFYDPETARVFKAPTHIKAAPRSQY